MFHRFWLVWLVPVTWGLKCISALWEIKKKKIISHLIHVSNGQVYDKHIAQTFDRGKGCSKIKIKVPVVEPLKIGTGTIVFLFTRYCVTHEPRGDLMIDLSSQENDTHCMASAYCSVKLLLRSFNRILMSATRWLFRSFSIRMLHIRFVVVRIHEYGQSTAVYKAHTVVVRSTMWVKRNILVCKYLCIILEDSKNVDLLESWLASH